MPKHGWVEFAPRLAAALKMSFVFVPAFGRVGRDGELRTIGNAILCAQPLEDFHAVPLSKPPFKFYRHPLVGAHQAVLARSSSTAAASRWVSRTWSGDGIPRDAARQMDDFLSAIGNEAPVIIGGDLNTTTIDMDRRCELLRAAAAIVMHPRRFREPRPHEPLFERIKEHGISIEEANVPGVPTFTVSRLVPPLWRPKLDWIAARGIRPVKGSATVVPARTSILGRQVSDHDFVMCEFRP